MIWFLTFLGTGWILYAVFGRRWWIDPVLRRPGVETVGRVVAVVPARNEALELPVTLPSLFRQTYPDLTVVVVDDHSVDGTAAVAERTAAEYGCAQRFRLVVPDPLPPGWMGKVWAQQRGWEEARRLGATWVWFTDADIRHAPDVLDRLLATAQTERRDFVSVMARLHCKSFWERLLIPAFTYFFAMLYPFPAVARDGSRVAAAAGGCMLIHVSLLERIGGLEAIRDAVIDDVSLAQACKSQGGRLWLGYYPGVESTRGYASLSAIWDMVARSAYSQLGYNPLALLFAVAGLLAVFVLPLVSAFCGVAGVRWWGWASYLAMVRTYAPMVRYLGCSLLWAFTLPLAALLYAGMTISSALRYYRGTRTSWKGRTYTVGS